MNLLFAVARVISSRISPVSDHVLSIFLADEIVSAGTAALATSEQLQMNRESALLGILTLAAIIFFAAFLNMQRRIAKQLREMSDDSRQLRRESKRHRKLLGKIRKHLWP